LEETMSSYWVNFAKTGNPNGEGLSVWPASDRYNPEVINLGMDMKRSPLPYKEPLYFLCKMNEIATE